MDLKGEQQLIGTPDQIWTLLLDPVTLAAIMPGCEHLELIEEDYYKGTIKAKIGPVSSQYNAKFKIGDKAPPNSYSLQIEGQGPGGFVNGDVQINLRANSEGTMMTYEGTATVGGKIASIGQRLVETGARLIIKQGFKALKKEVESKVEE